MDSRTFAVERLNVGDWPRTDGQEEQVIPPEVWSAIGDHDSRILDPVVFAFDVSPDRRFGSISVAGRRKDGFRHVELIDRRKGTGWMAERMEGLVEKYDVDGVLCDEKGPAASLIPEMEDVGVEVTTVNARQYTKACGDIYDGAEQAAEYLALEEDERPAALPVKAFRHLDQDELNGAVKGAAKRALGDAWAWSRKGSNIDITPLVSGTLALWGLDQGGGSQPWEKRAARGEALL